MPDPNINLLARWFEEVWNQGREEAIDELAAPDVVAHGLVDAQGQEVSGREKFHLFWRQFRQAFPDVHIDVHDGLVDGNRVMVRCTARATHSGEGFAVPPTQKAIAFTGMVIARVRNGQLAEVWDNWDFLSLYQQLGVATLPVA